VGAQRVDGVHAPLHARLGHVLAEEDDVRLQHAAAAVAVRHDEAAGLLELDVAIGADDHLRVSLGPAGVERVEAGLELASARGGAAVEADDVGDPAVQRDQPPRARLLVEPVDVLGDEQLGVQRRERVVGGVRLGSPHPAPAEVAARPVALPCRGARDELLERHRHPLRRVRPAVVGDAGVG